MSSFTAYIIITVRVRVSVRVRVKDSVLGVGVMVMVSASVRLRCRLANKVSVRCGPVNSETTIIYRTVQRITSALVKLFCFGITSHRIKTTLY